MNTQRRLDKAQELAQKKYGHEYVNVGTKHYRLDVVRTGSLMLDYKLGIGGFPYGHAVEVFGAKGLGKSSAIGYPVLANVQAEGKLPALLAVEPRFTTPEDREWGRKLGIDPDMLHILYPDHVQEAADMLRHLVFENLVDYIMIDTLGAMGNESGAQVDGKKKAYGISGEITSAMNDIMPRLYKNNIGLLILNQQRQAPSPAGRPGLMLYESPGGEALKHHCRIRIQLKPGSNRYTTKIDDEDVLIGRELTCVMRKNNMSQAAEKTARFDFFHIETAQYGFGIDMTQDIINAGKVTGVLQGASWIEHRTFPGKHKLQGKQQVKEFLTDNPESYETIRQEVLAVMIQKELDAAKVNQERLQNAEVVKNGSEGVTESAVGSA